MYSAPRMTQMSVASLARAAGVMCDVSKSRSLIASCSMFDAEQSMMSMSPCCTTSRICCRYSGSVFQRISDFSTRSGLSGRFCPGAVMPNAMSASFASAMINALLPDGFARMSAIFWSSDCCIRERRQPCTLPSVSLSALAELCRPLSSFGQSSISICCTTPARPTTVGTLIATSRMP